MALKIRRLPLSVLHKLGHVMKRRKIKPRNMVAVAAHFRSSAGAMDSSKKSRKKEKELLEKQLEDGMEDATTEDR